MRRITIKSDEFGNVSVTGNPDRRSDFFVYALEKVMAGKFKELSWEPIEPLIRQKEEEIL